IDQQPGQVAQAIIEFVSGLLLVLIIIELLGTVVHYLQAHITSLRPFLFIGIISATRSILSIGARLSVEGFNLKPIDFTHAMIDLAVSAAVILALGVRSDFLAECLRMASQNSGAPASYLLLCVPRGKSDRCFSCTH